MKTASVQTTRRSITPSSKAKPTPSQMPPRKRSGDGYQEMVADMANGTFQPDFVPDLDTENVPNPFDKYDAPDAPDTRKHS